MSLLRLLYCIMAMGVVGHPHNGLSDNNVCNTIACTEFGQMVHDNINNSVEPCIDFYEYGCGLWPTNNPIPSTEFVWSVGDKLNLKTYYRIKELLENESEYDDLPPIKMIKQFYRSCMDEDAIERQGLEPMQSLLDSNGGWPLLMTEDSNSENYTWQEINKKYFETFGSGRFFKIEYRPDKHNSSRYMIIINQEFDISLVSKTVRRIDRYSALYGEAMAKIAQAFEKHKRVKVPLQKFRSNLLEILIFEGKLRNITKEEDESYSYRMTIAELQEFYDSAETEQPTAKIDWLNFIQSVFKSVNISIDASESVLVYDKYLFQKLAYLLDETPSHTIVNYMQLSTVGQFIKHLNKKMRNIEFKMKHLTYNVTEQKQRWRHCIAEMPIRDAVSYLFVKKYMSPDIIKNVKEMVEDIKAEMKERILHSTWTNNDTKHFMLDKMDNILQQIAYPEWYNNQTEFVEQYKGLEFNENYFQNVLTALQYKKRKELAKFRKPVDRNEWITYPITVNAFYAESTNKMIIPAAVIQDPYFTPGMPLAVNYAIVGSVVGHEFAHSFDTSGIQYDKFGNRLSWHSDETNEAYKERAECFVDQFNNFTLDVRDEDGDPIEIDGEFTLDENIADSIGIEVAFAAFQKRKMKMGAQPKLPGVTNISDEELFFLSYTNSWCMSTLNEFMADMANTNEHSPSKYRILGSLDNLEAFSRIHNCSLGSPMNPELKCDIWK